VQYFKKDNVVDENSDFDLGQLSFFFKLPLVKKVLLGGFPLFELER